MNMNMNYQEKITFLEGLHSKGKEDEAHGISDFSFNTNPN